ncbi:flavodoxin family protein [Enterococcus sp. LJL99]
MKQILLRTSIENEAQTAKIIANLFGNSTYTQINLADYHLNQLGQDYDGDEFFLVINQLQEADVLVIETPVYWSSMSGYLKNFLDRLTELPSVDFHRKFFPPKKRVVYLIVANSNPKIIASIEQTIKEVCAHFSLSFKVTITDGKEAERVNMSLERKMIQAK